MTKQEADEMKLRWDNWMFSLVESVKSIAHNNYPFATPERTVLETAALNLDYMRTSWTLEANLCGLKLDNERLRVILKHCIGFLRTDETRQLYFEACKLTETDVVDFSVK